MLRLQQICFFSAGNLCHRMRSSLVPLQRRAKGVFLESGNQRMLSRRCCRLPGTEQRTDCLDTRSYTHYLDAGRRRDLDISSVPLNNLRSAGQVHSSSLSEKERSKFSPVWIPDVAAVPGMQRRCVLSESSDLESTGRSC